VIVFNTYLLFSDIFIDYFAAQEHRPL